MVKNITIAFFLILTSCSTLQKKVVKCPKLTAPKIAAEIIVNSENNLPVYIGLRGVRVFCTKDGDNIEMEAFVNIRAVRNGDVGDDYVPVNISIVSVDEDNKEYDRDGYSYSQFLINKSKIVDRESKIELKVPKEGQVFLGIR